MPKVEVEILRTVTITREENVTVELNVPQQVLNDGDVVGWVDRLTEGSEDKLSAKDKALRAAITGAEWEVSDEDESIEYNEAYES